MVYDIGRSLQRLDRAEQLNRPSRTPRVPESAAPSVAKRIAQLLRDGHSGLFEGDQELDAGDG
jgi:hypothetical protein